MWGRTKDSEKQIKLKGLNELLEEAQRLEVNKEIIELILIAKATVITGDGFSYKLTTTSSR